MKKKEGGKDKNKERKGGGRRERDNQERKRAEGRRGEEREGEGVKKALEESMLLPKVTQEEDRKEPVSHRNVLFLISSVQLYTAGDGPTQKLNAQTQGQFHNLRHWGVPQCQCARHVSYQRPDPQQCRIKKEGTAEKETIEGIYSKRARATKPLKAFLPLT